jgi:ribonuclease BN (tRNA processing enzyme)
VPLAAAGPQLELQCLTRALDRQTPKAAIQYFGVSAEIRIADGGRTVPLEKVFIGHDVAPGVVFQDANVKVTAARNSHFDFHTGGARFGSYAYRFETADRVIVFTGDTGPSETVTRLASGADLLVSEVNSVDDRVTRMKQDGQWQAMSEAERAGIRRQASMGHLSPEEVGRMAAAAGVKAVVLTHLTQRPPPNTDRYEPWVEEVRKHFAGPVFVARDLMAF